MRVLLTTTLLMLTTAAPVVAQMEQADAQYGSWFYVEQTDPITDANTSSILVLEIDEDKVHTFAFKCMPHGDLYAMLLVDAGFTAAIADYATIVWRVDKNEPSEQQRWESRQTEGSASMFYAKDTTARSIAAQAKPATQLAVRAWTDEGDPIGTYIFPLDGFTRAIGQLPCAGE